MISNIQVFSNDEFTIRTINENGGIWFVAKDVMTALEYSEDSNPARIMQSVPEIWKGVKQIHTTSDNPTARPYQDWKGIKRINTLGGEQEMLCLTEQGLYFF